MLNRPENIFTYLFASLLFLLAAVLLYWGFRFPAFGYETHIFEASWYSIQEGGHSLPRLPNGEQLYHTPILPYWISSLGGLLVGNSSLGFRLLHIALAIAGVWGFFRVARQYLDARAAFYSCCVLAASLPFGWQMMLATPDSLAALSVSSALLTFYLYLKTRKEKYFWLLYGSLAAGILSKGLLPLVLSLFSMVVYLMFKIKMDVHTLRKIRAGKGSLMVLLLSAPWFIYAGFQTGGTWLQVFFHDYHIGRFFGETETAEAPFYQAFLYSILLILPFGVFLPGGFSYSWKYKVKKDLLFLSALSLMVILFFFAFSDTFYPHYLLPALPFAALLVGYRFSSLAGRSLIKLTGVPGIALLVILSFGLPVYLFMLLQGKSGSFSGLDLSLFYILLGILPLATLSCLYLWHRKKTDAGVCLLTLSYLLFNLLLMWRLAPADESLWEPLKMLLQ